MKLLKGLTVFSVLFTNPLFAADFEKSVCRVYTHKPSGFGRMFVGQFYDDEKGNVFVNNAGETRPRFAKRLHGLSKALLPLEIFSHDANVEGSFGLSYVGHPYTAYRHYWTEGEACARIVGKFALVNSDLTSTPLLTFEELKEQFWWMAFQFNHFPELKLEEKRQIQAFGMRSNFEVQFNSDVAP